MSHDQYSYRPNMNRNVTRKWAEARQVDYGGDDWGDDAYGSYEEQPIQPPLSQDRRVYTNPPALDTSHRRSFDRADERRGFSASDASSAGFPAFHNAQPGAPRYYEQHQGYAPPTRHQTTPMQGMHMSGESESTGRPSMDTHDMEDPTVDSRDSTAAVRAFPRRESSLRQPDAPADTPPDPVRAPAPAPAPASAAATSKPLPFVRPADIYKRMEEEKEKERRSQESSRPSMDSIHRDTAPGAPAVAQSNVAETDTTRRRQPTLDTVAERRSEYGLESKIDTPVRPIDTGVPQQMSYPSASSKYTDRPDPVSATTEDSRFPSRTASQQYSDYGNTPSLLPQITRSSTFGSDFVRRDSTGANSAQQSSAAPPPPPPPKDGLATVPENSSELQHKTSLGYRTMVNDAFDAENQTRGSPAASQDSMLRSNTTSTADISPIVERSKQKPWNRPAQQATTQQDDIAEDLPTPRRLGTHRRDSPSPARRPLSAESPHIPEPQSAILTEDRPAITQDTATQAHIMRPGPAVLVHQQPKSREFTNAQDVPAANQTDVPSFRKQELQASGISDQRTASEEWLEWSAAKKEFNARNGFIDSNPTTPAFESSNMSSPAPAFGSLDKKGQLATSEGHENTVKPLTGIASLSPASRPQNTREESFRPSLPGGWLSSTSIPRAGTPEPSIASVVSTHRPGLAGDNARTESVESVPTASAPKRENWRSEYSGIQAQAFAAAATAGSALAGIFNGPSLTSSTTDDSEVSSVNEHDAGPTSRNRESAVAARDPAATPPVDQPAVSGPSATRGFSSTTPGSERATPVARGRHTESDTAHRPPRVPATTGASTAGPELKKAPLSITRDDSPSKASDRWWSDDEESRSVTDDVPAPLRTSRLVESKDSARPPISHNDSEDGPDPEQLETDIVKSLTPKSSSLHRRDEIERQRPLGHAGPSDSLRQTSPPFAAAALALSPSRESKSLQEQNSFQPLLAPQVENQAINGPSDVPRGPEVPAGSTSATTTLPSGGTQDNRKATSAPPRSQDHVSGGIATPLAAAGAAKLTTGATRSHPEDNQAMRNLPSQPTVPSTSAPTAGQPITSPPAAKKPESPALARLNSSAKKEFTIMSDGPVAFPPSPHTHSMRDQPGNQAAQTPVTPHREKPAHALETQVATSFPTRATANGAQTVPAPENQGEDLAPVHAVAADQTLRDRWGPAAPATADHDESRSISTTAPAVRPSHESPRSATAISDITARPSTPTSKPATPTASSTSAIFTPQTNKTAQLSYPYDFNTALPVDKVPIPQIVGMGSARQRIRAYNDNRDVYIQPVGHLESWLSAMNTPEHADVFSGQRSADAQYSTPPRPHHGRESSGASGSKHMQEDGRRLLEGAKKYGGKAGFLGKGLFSKGKEKLRTVSANNKGSRNASSSAETTGSRHSSTSASAPQLPAPSITTPIDETSLSQYCSTKQSGDSGVTGPWMTTRNAAQPPFSPISEVSTRETDNLSTPYRPVSNISQDQTPRSQHTIKHLAKTTSNTALQSPLDASDKRKSAAAVSTIDPEHDVGRNSTDRLNASGGNNRRNSSVSDVSSVSGHSHRQSMAARTVSPPMEQQAPHNVHPYTAVAASSTAPSASPATAAKTEERVEDPSEEATLPGYSQSSAQPPRMAPGAQIVPVARLGHDQVVPAEQSRPFSFVGNDSLLHTGQNMTPTMDSLNAQSRGLIQGSNTDPRNIRHQANNALALDVPREYGQEKSESPLPSARRPPEELAKYRQNAAPFAPQEEEGGGFRIPGPYTRELRSPKAKSQSPIKEQVQPDYPSDYPSSAMQGVTLDTSAVASSAQPAQMHQHPTPMQPQQEPQHQQRYLQQQIESASTTPGASNDGDRKGSKLGGLFRTRSKSQSRKQHEAEGPRPEIDNRRHSLFRLGSRTSMSSRGAGGEQHDQVANQQRLQPGPRRLSKDLFKSTTFNQQHPRQANFVRPVAQGPEQPMSAPAGKKKRFSGLFGKAPVREQYQQQVPSRASTLPLNASHPNIQSQSLYNQHPANRPYAHQQPGPPFHGMQPPQEGYHGQPQVQEYGRQEQQFSQPKVPGAYQDQQARGQQQPRYAPAPIQTSFYSQATSPRPQDQGQASSSWQQQGQRPFQYNQQQQQQQQQPGAMRQYPPDQRPDLRVNTSDRQSSFVPGSAPPVPNSYLQSRQAAEGAQAAPSTAASYVQRAQTQIPETRTNKDISYGSDLRLTTASPVGQHAQPSSSQQTSNITPRVQALHTRSRSPKLGRPTSEDLTEEINNLAPSPANDLGTFSGKKVSPAGGITRSPEDQEKPWTIGLPGQDTQTDQNADPASATSARQREVKRIMLERASANANNSGAVTSPDTEPNRPQTVAEKFMGHGMPAPKGTTKAMQPPTSTSTSTSTATGVAPSPKRSFSNVSLSKNPSLRGKGPTLSRSGTPVGNAPAPPKTTQENLAAGIANASYAGDNASKTAGPATTQQALGGEQSVFHRQAPRPSGHQWDTSSLTDDGRTDGSEPPSRVQTWSQARHTPEADRQPGSTDASAHSTNQVDDQDRDRDLGRSSTGERNDQYPASTIVSLASKNREIASKLQQPQSTARTPPQKNAATVAPRDSTYPAPNAPTAASTFVAPPTTQPSVPSTSTTAVPRDMHAPTHENTIHNLTRDKNAMSQHPRDADPRTTIANAPTPPPEEPRTARAPPQTSKTIEIHELVGSRPEGYESDDEPMMSATAYPGQEWQPVFDRWED